ncbi:MAG: BsuPI-related putative proteinase inhibitor, partial [Acetivibrionales bacterium]
KFIDELKKQADIDSVLKDKNLNSTITLDDFRNVVRLFIDEEYEGTADSIAREAIVYEFTRLWANKTGKNLDEIATIKMLIYVDTDKIEAKYNHAITVAYLKDIARGRGHGIFDPKTGTTYGELATLAYFTDKAIKNSMESENLGIVKGRLETRASYEIMNEKVIFDFELMSHYTYPVELTFSSGQQFEVVITDESENEVYRYSDDKSFTMALVYKTINPGESFTWQDEWDMKNKVGKKLSSGSYKAVINILASTESDDVQIDENELIAVLDFSL